MGEVAQRRLELCVQAAAHHWLQGGSRVCLNVDHFHPRRQALSTSGRASGATPNTNTNTTNTNTNTNTPIGVAAAAAAAAAAADNDGGLPDAGAARVSCARQTERIDAVVVVVVIAVVTVVAAAAATASRTPALENEAHSLVQRLVVSRTTIHYLDAVAVCDASCW